MSRPSPNRATENLVLGNLGETFVKNYLQQKNWQILAAQWHCRWGELDLVAYHPSSKIVAFVEVKTRRRHGLDQHGLLAITPSKQRKTIKAALAFLTEFPKYENYGCRFDVALISYQGSHLENYQFALEQYLEAAFEADEF